MACHCSWCSENKRIGTLRELQDAECSRAKTKTSKKLTHRHLMDKLNFSRKRLLDTIDRDEEYRAFLLKKYGKIPKHVYLGGLQRWYKEDYEKALKNARAAGIDVQA